MGVWAYGRRKNGRMGEWENLPLFYGYSETLPENL
jgi:hypothetical protein